MDLATLIGVLGAFGVIAGAVVMGGSISTFVNVPSIFIVIGGTLMVVLMRSSVANFLGALNVAGRAFSNKLNKPEDLIEQVVEMATIARKDGMIALESHETGNEFLQKGIDMLVDGQGPDQVKSLLRKEAEMIAMRQKSGAAIYESIGDYAPAMGMIGTLVGLVQMLANMNDPKALGPAMAVALLTTLYGAIIANVIAFPIMQKLNDRSSTEALNNELIIRALLFIQEGGNPRLMADMLNSYLDPKVRAKLAGAT